jgi:hypothetical protein
MSAWVRLALLLPLCATGCIAYARGQGGAAFGTSRQQGHSGPIITADTAFHPLKIRNEDSALDPLIVQTSVEALVASQRKDLGWGTGLGLMTPLVPVGGQVIIGTNAHVGFQDGKTSFGNISPYLDLGVRAPLASDSERYRRQTFLSLDFTCQTYFDFLHKRAPEQIICIKFGLGWGD